MSPSLSRKHQLQDSLIYHVYNRSNRKLRIFEDDIDCTKFMRLLARYAKRFKLMLYHWVIMPTHYHLLLEIDQPEKISALMAGLNRAYTHHHHARRGAVGYLWQGRFNSLPIQKEQYLLACGRYIERNPVRSAIVTRASDYPFSSARFYCDGTEDDITCEDPMFKDFGENDEIRQERYKDYLKLDSESDKDFTQFKTPLGDEEFKRRLIRINGQFLPIRRGRPSERIVA